MILQQKRNWNHNIYLRTLFYLYLIDLFTPNVHEFQRVSKRVWVGGDEVFVWVHFDTFYRFWYLVVISLLIQKIQWYFDWIWIIKLDLWNQFQFWIIDWSMQYDSLCPGNQLLQLLERPSNYQNPVGSLTLAETLHFLMELKKTSIWWIDFRWV